MESKGKRVTSSRHRRPKHPKPLRLTERDTLIVKAVNDYRVLGQDQIRRLFFPSKNTAQLRLQLLWQHGYLRRQFRLLSPSSPATEIVYLLDKKGAELLQLSFDYSSDQLRLSKSSQVSELFLHHTIGLSETRLQLAQSCTKNSLSLQWLDETAMKRSYDKVQVGRSTVSIIPDSFCMITSETVKYLFFIEFDRSTEHVRYIRRKFRAFNEYFLSGACKARYGTNQIRVLTIVDRDARGRLNRLQTVLQELGDRGRYLLTTLAQLQNGDFLTDSLWVQASKPNYCSIL